MRKIPFFLIVLLSGLSPWTRAVDCTPISVNAIDHGWYDSSGYHGSFNDNYLCGNSVSTPMPRNWFVFSIPALTQQLASASLRIYTFGVASPQGSETFELRHVNTPVGALRLGGNGLTNVYADLADGVIYGSRTFINAETYVFVNIPLNEAFLANVAAASGGTLALGGNLTTLNSSSNVNEYLFGNSGSLANSNQPAVQLLLTYVNDGTPIFTQQPSSVTVNSGAAFSLQAQVCGGPLLTLQWQRHGTNIPGATSLLLQLSNVTTNDTGPYRLVASNASGTATSDVATVTVNYAAPVGSIYLSSGQLPALASSTVRLCASISAIPAPAYQWQRNGTNLPGANSSCLQLSNISSNEAGNYRVAVTNIYGAFTSAPMVVAVNYLPPTGSIYQSGGFNPALAGGQVSFCANISAAPAASYQWQFNGTNLVGQTGNCLFLNNVTSNQAGSYRLVANNSVGSFTSAPLALAVSYLAPTVGSIYLSSGSSPAQAGATVILCATRNGAPYPTGQWQFNGVNLPGETGNCLSLYNVSSNHVGNYRLVVSNVLGVATSSTFALAVNYLAPTGSIYFSGGYSPAPAGSALTLCGNIQGAPFPTIQWQRNGTNLPGALGSCLGFSNLSSNEAGLYRLVLSNSITVFTSAPVELAVSYIPPTATLSSSGVLPPILEGLTLTLCSTVSGAPAPTRQWYYNGVPLPATGSCLQIFNIKTNQSGLYTVVASNIAGMTTSAVAVVSVVHAAPTVSAYLSSGTTPALIGNNLTLCASVSGAPAPSPQWLFNGTNLIGATSFCLTLTNVQPHQAGNYSIVASNALGVSTSQVVTISVVTQSVVRAYFSYGAPPFALGSAPTLCSAITLPPPFTRQWRFNGVDVPGETNACFQIYPLDFNDVGNYTVVATDGSGSYTSPPVALTVYIAPPQNAAPSFYGSSPPFLVGDDVSLAAYYSGSPSYVQWRFNGTNMPGQTNFLLSLLGVTVDQIGNYSFTATNLAGATTSSVVNLTVDYQEPYWVVVPQPQIVVAGNLARFQAFARGGPPPVYYLQVNGTNVAVPFTYEGCCGAESGGFSLLDVSTADAGSYVIIASNFLGTITSPPAQLLVTPAGPLDKWTQRNPLPQSQVIYDVAHGPQQLVAVGDHGTILTSSNGSNWALQNRRADLPLYGVAYGAGTFVAVGEGGTILSSSDGTNWAYRYSAANTFLNDVTFASGRFFAIGTAPALGTIAMISTDGINWGRAPLGGSLSAQQCVTYGNGLFVAAGLNSIAKSADGTNWSTVFLPNRVVESVTYANGFFVAVGDDGTIHVSSDGTAWQTRLAVTSRRLLGVAYGAGKFVTVGARGTILTSTDTITWTPTSGGTLDRLETLGFVNGLFIAAGENGTIITSTNGTSWTKQNIGITRDLDGMEVANGVIVTVGKGGSILTSTDGTHYTVQNSPVTNDLHGVTWGGGLWVAVGEPGIVLTSPDAVQWTQRVTGSSNSLKGATYAKGLWVVVGTQGSVITSTNGVNWSETTIYSNVYLPPFYEPFDLNDVAYGNGQFLIAGDGPGNQNGSLFQSTNGLAWTQAAFYPGKNLRGITFANGIFVIAANDGRVFYGDGLTFFNVSYPGGGNLRAVTWVNGLWVVVGNNGSIFTTTDLFSWTRRASRTFENFHRVVHLDGKLVAIGNRGTVLQSGRFITDLAPPRYEPGIGFTFGLRGVIGQPYVIEASTDLLNWSPLLHFTNEIETTTFTDTNALQQSRRFYRVTEP
jgi:hypothetical protein